MSLGKPTDQADAPVCILQDGPQAADPDAGVEAIGIALADIQERLELAAEATEHAGRFARAADLREAAALLFEVVRLTSRCRAGRRPGGARTRSAGRETF